ncbi:MAG: PAS domain S-box protein, partial [Deltaproteobacteria bacterium]|nr:PAS domain S-box protein [Deltaproteobacteria bacterium]
MNKKAKKPSYEELEKRIEELEKDGHKFQQKEDELKDTRDKYRDIIDLVQEGYFEIDLRGNFLFFNKRIYDFLGYTRDELAKITYRDYTTPEEYNRIYTNFNEVYRTGKDGVVRHHELIKKDGSIGFAELHISLMKNETGESVGFQCVARNLTEKKKIEKALRKSEEKYRTILETMEEGYYETDLAGNYTFINEAELRLFGYSSEELIGMNYQEHSIPENAKRIYKVFNEVYKTGIPAKMIEYEIIKKDGSHVVLESSTLLIRDENGKPIGFRGVSRHVTERKNAEEALRKSEERHRSILENMEEGYYEVDLAGNYTFYNEAACKTLGYARNEMIGMNNREYSTPEEAKKMNKIFKEVYRTGVPAKVIDYEITTKDGSTKTLETSASLIRNEDGKPVGFCGITRDMTDKKKAINALSDSEEKYRLLVENSNDAIFIEQDGAIKFSNTRAEGLTGYPAEELERIPFVNMIHPGDKKSFIDQHKKESGDDNKQAEAYVFRIKNAKEETLWIEMSSVEIIWEGKIATLKFLKDITQHKKIEAQFIQAQKMESLGTLAGGIAHDFNNLLMGIQGNASLVQLALGEKNPHIEKLKSIEHLVKDGSELTKQLLGVARGGKYEVLPTNVNKIVKKSADMFGRTRKEISIHKILKKDLWVTEIDRSQIEQVLLNLYVNAWHAMPDGGDLYLETKNTTLDEYYTKNYGTDPGKYIRITVTDNGIGMDEETRKRVFDPFFTTKEMGRGTGLGLASAYGIIRNHKGIINVYSEIEQGTTFNIYLPISGKKVDEEKYYKEEIRSGKETILFVDDEDTIIEVGQQLLEILGYKVVLTKSGKETIDVYQKKKGKIDLIILDMVMPEMSGGDTYDRLKEINPDVKVLLSSGYSLNGQAEEILKRGCKGFIQKPFSLEELSKRIREV